MAKKVVTVNRAPVLTLWAVVVAERLGHEEETALTLGRALAGLNAQSKGRRLGIYGTTPPGDAPRGEDTGPRRRARPSDSVPLFGREVPVVRTPKGIRASADGKPMDPAAVRRYLDSKFGEDLPAVRSAMEALAASLAPEALAAAAYELYERFRPAIPAGKRGWGAAGELDLDRIRALRR